MKEAGSVPPTPPSLPWSLRKGSCTHREGWGCKMGQEVSSKDKSLRPRDFPGGPVVKTPHFHCRGVGSTPGRGAKIPHAARCCQKKKKNPGLRSDLHPQALTWAV